MNVSSLRKRRLRVASVVALAMVLALWLLQSELSPLFEFTLTHPGLVFPLAALSLPAVLIATVASGNVHQPSAAVFYLSAAIQWFAVGYLLAVVVVRDRKGARSRCPAGPVVESGALGQPPRAPR